MDYNTWHPARELNSQYRTFVDSAFAKQNTATNNWPIIFVIYLVLMVIFLFMRNSGVNPLYFLLPLLLIPVLGMSAKKKHSHNYTRISMSDYEWREGNFTKAGYKSRSSRYVYVDDIQCDDFPFIRRYRIPVGAKMLMIRFRNPDGTFHHYAISMDKLN